MASLGQTFDANAVEPSSGDFEIIPAGKYLAMIVDSTMKETKAGNGQYLALDLVILEGAHTNAHLFERLNLVNPNEKAVEISQRTLSAICRATGKMSVSDSEQLHDIPMIVTVKVKPAGPDKQGIERRAQNEIGGYEAAGGQSSPPATGYSGPGWKPPSGGNAPPAAAAAAPAPKPAATAPWRRAG